MSGDKEKYTCIYVGGIKDGYGFGLLINTFKELYKKNNSYKLILICREYEWNPVKTNYENTPWLEVYHVSGDELDAYYKRASVGIIPKLKTEYNELAVSVKLYEYISYGLPVIAVSNKATDRIIIEGKIGDVSEEDPVEFAKKIDEVITNEIRYNNLKYNVEVFLLENNLWVNRAKTIAKDLISIEL